MTHEFAVFARFRANGEVWMKDMKRGFIDINDAKKAAADFDFGVGGVETTLVMFRGVPEAPNVILIRQFQG